MIGTTNEVKTVIILTIKKRGQLSQNTIKLAKIGREITEQTLVYGREGVRISTYHPQVS
jgi:hypothetical protein